LCSPWYPFCRLTRSYIEALARKVAFCAVHPGGDEQKIPRVEGGENGGLDFWPGMPTTKNRTSELLCRYFATSLFFGFAKNK